MLNRGIAKARLANGMLEAAIRRAGFEELVCVGNFVGVIRTVWSVDPGYDGPGAIFALCTGVFVDENWFRSCVRLVSDPTSRAGEIDLSSDWWILDDEAERHFTAAGREEIFRANVGRRVFVPEPDGDGADVLRWLGGLPAAAATRR